MPLSFISSPTGIVPHKPDPYLQQKRRRRKPKKGQICSEADLKEKAEEQM
jgi:hypothetical protein